MLLNDRAQTKGEKGKGRKITTVSIAVSSTVCVSVYVCLCACMCAPVYVCTCLCEPVCVCSCARSVFSDSFPFPLFSREIFQPVLLKFQEACLCRTYYADKKKTKKKDK